MLDPDATRPMTAVSMYRILKMRHQFGFMATVASAIVAVGIGLIGVGVAEAQANKSGKAGLNLWGNIWFVLGVCLIILGGVAVAIAVAAYMQEQRRARKDKLRAGHKLSVGQSLYSPNGRFQLKMQEDGNLVAYLFEQGQPIFATDTGGTGTSNYLEMQNDGNLVLYTNDRRAVWATGTEGKGGKLLKMQDDGNLVIYAEGGKAEGLSAASPFGPAGSVKVAPAAKRGRTTLTGSAGPKDNQRPRA